MKHRKKAALLLGAGAALGTAAAAAGCVRTTAKVLRRPAEQPHKEPTGERAARIEQVRRQAARLVEQYPPEEVTITSDDGLALHGLVFTPPDADKVAVLVHGYHSSGLREFGSIAWYCIRRGWRVLLVDDVITTGATAAACAQALLSAGAESVFAVAVATVEFPPIAQPTLPLQEDADEEI